MKTLTGLNKWLYLKSEVEQHYIDKIETLNIYYPKITEYINSLRNIDINYLMFVVPDKSVVCTKNIPNDYNINNQFRFINNLKTKFSNIIDIHDLNIIDENDYQITDSHMNLTGGLKVAKVIARYFINDISIINSIDNSLSYNIQNNICGDLTMPINLDPKFAPEFKEDVVIISNNYYTSYENKINCLSPEYRNCLGRKSLYVHNKNPIIKKKILIFGDSTTCFLIYNFLSFYFEEIIFYWNHMLVAKALYDIIKPDIFIEIKTERLLVRR